MMSGMEFIPFVLWSLSVGLAGGLYGVICSVFGENRARARLINRTGAAYSACVMFLWFLLLRNDVNWIAYLWIAIPLLISVFGFALTLIPRSSLYGGERAKTRRRIAFRTSLAMLGALLIWTIARSFVGVDERSTFEIQSGMTREEVIRILGEPSAKESGGLLWEYTIATLNPRAFLNPFTFCLEFDEGGKVSRAWFD